MASAPITPTPQPDQPRQVSGPDFMKEVGGFSGTPAQSPQPGFWKTLLMGALNGLAGAKGATSFGGGAAGGAAGEIAAKQQQFENTQEAAKTQSDIKFRDMQSAVAAANLSRQDHEMHQADETHQQERDKFAQETVDFNEKHFGITYKPIANSGVAAQQYLEQATANDPNGAHVPSGIVMSPSTIYVPVQDVENSPLKEYNYLQKMGPLFGLPIPSRSDYMSANPAQRRLMLEPVQNLVSGHGRDGQPLNPQQLDSAAAYVESNLKTYGSRSDADQDVLAQGQRTLGLLKAQQEAQRESEERKFKRQLELASERGKSYGQNRVVSWVDENGTMHTGFASELPKNGTAAPVAGAMKSESAMAMFDEMKIASDKLRSAISKMEPLSPVAVAKISTAMRDQHSITSAEFKGLGLESLSDAQKDFVIWATQLNERAMSLRSVAGFGQGSDSMRAAIQATLPGAGSGSTKTALKQLDAFDNQVALLRKGVVKTPRAAKAEAAAAPGPKVGDIEDGYRFKGGDKADKNSWEKVTK